MRKGFLKSIVMFCAFVIVGGYLSLSSANAQELVLDKQVIVKAEVLQILKQEVRDVAGTDTSTDVQMLDVRILEGAESGKEITIENDYFILKSGEVFYLMHTTDGLSGQSHYAVFEPYRLPALYFFIALFIACVLLFGGWQGLRGLAALAGSFLFIFFLLFPAILSGWSPILVSIGVASLIVILGSYITHGFNKTTTSAVIGMIMTIFLTGILAYIAVSWTRLSGFESEEAVYLNFDTRGSIDFVGLLLGGILIGLLGVLYDAAISQAIAIEELHRAGPHLPRRYIFTRAMRMGKEHIGALVNTLAIAYVGASLPLLLLFYSSVSDFSLAMNREIFAAEIIRTIIGSIGLILAVPITTFISVIMIVRRVDTPDMTTMNKEQKAVETLH